MEYKKMNIKEIRQTWNCSSYKFIVWVDDRSDFAYILATLTKWFGSAEYMWNNAFLCGNK